MNCKECGFDTSQTFVIHPSGSGWMCASCKINMDPQVEALMEERNEIEQQKAHDPVNHPKHYTSHPSGIECIQVTRHMTFNIGNAIKYLWRAGQKDSEIQDLEKAVWYIKDEINRLKK